jgi:hypothetical protein
VFLALAVGILLGAGPLKEPIESSLADQVSSLRDEKTVLRDQLAAAAELGDYADATLRALQGEALAGLLTGQAVAVVKVGEVSEARLEDLKSGLAAAGAELAAEVSLDEAWVGAAEETRAEAAAAVGELLGGAAAGLGDHEVIAAGLAWALVGTAGADGQGGDDGGDGAEGQGGDATPGAGDADAGQPSDAAEPPTDAPAGGAGEETGGGETGGEPGGETGGGEPGGDETEGGQPGAAVDIGYDLLAALGAARLASGTLTEPATAVVVLSGTYFDDPAEVEPDAVTTGRREEFVGVVAALAAAGLTTVVCGPDQAETDLVRRLRADEEISAQAATVAAALPGAESITALWAVAAGFHSVVGAWGMAGGEAALPPYLPAPLGGQGDPGEDLDPDSPTGGGGVDPDGPASGEPTATP